MRLALSGLAVVVMLFCGLALAAEQRYVYDNLGRLIAVVDEAGNATTYSYDPAGNLISVTRQGGGGALAVTAFTPDRGKAGDAITILGAGFLPGAAANTVTFNGTPATVSSATASAIVATVPVGATSGPVTVSNANGSAASGQSFTVLVAPVISAVTPAMVARGMSTRVEIGGSSLRFASSVVFAQPGIVATILPGGSDQLLPVTLNVGPSVPAGAYVFSVSNPAGTSQSGTVTVTVGIRPTGAAFSVARPLTVFAPSPAQLNPVGSSASVAAAVSVFAPAAAQIAPSGSAMSVGRPVSVFVPAAAQIAPSGAAMTVARSVSVFAPLSSQVAPSGSAMSVTPPVSVSMP